jgi:hypothetical protein
MMGGAQPVDQLALEVYAIFHTELPAALGPPTVNAAVANQFTGIEEDAGIGAPKKLFAA